MLCIYQMICAHRINVLHADSSMSCIRYTYEYPVTWKQETIGKVRDAHMGCMNEEIGRGFILTGV